MITLSLKGANLVDLDSISLPEACDFGGLAVLRDAWSRFGLDALFSSIPSQHAARLQAMIFARLLFPSSKLALADQARSTVLALACGLPHDEAFDEDDLYTAMDQLIGRWSPLVRNLYHSTFPQKANIALYDITSVYFEGKGPTGLAHYGYSRDHRSDRVQVNLAVVTNEQGIPISLSVLRGNRADNKTLLGLLKILKRRFGITEATFVFDGGMSGTINLAAMQEAGLSYVTRLSNATLETLLSQSTETLAEVEQMELGDKPKLIEVQHAGKRYILAGGAWRAQRDRQRREARLKKGEATLKKLAASKRKNINVQKLASTIGRALERDKAHKYFDYTIDEQGQIQWARKKSIITEEQSRDGWYLLHTNHSRETCATEQVLGHYKSLLEVEDAFRELKTYLEVRPIYHHKPHRVINHIRICYLAYWMSARIGREWGMAGEVQEVTRLLRKLQTIRIGKLKIGEQTQRTVMTEVPKDLEETIQKLNLNKHYASPPKWVTEKM
jgi:transposase